MQVYGFKMKAYLLYTKTMGLTQEDCPAPEVTLQKPKGASSSYQLFHLKLKVEISQSEVNVCE